VPCACIAPTPPREPPPPGGEGGGWEEEGGEEGRAGGVRPKEREEVPLEVGKEEEEGEESRAGVYCVKEVAKGAEESVQRQREVGGVWV